MSRIKIKNVNDDIPYCNIFIDEKHVGYYYYDTFSKVYVYAYGRTYRGRHYYTSDSKSSRKLLLKDLKGIYQL